MDQKDSDTPSNLVSLLGIETFPDRDDSLATESNDSVQALPADTLRAFVKHFLGHDQVPGKVKVALHKNPSVRKLLFGEGA